MASREYYLAPLQKISKQDLIKELEPLFRHSLQLDSSPNPPAKAPSVLITSQAFEASQGWIDQSSDSLMHVHTPRDYAGRSTSEEMQLWIYENLKWMLPKESPPIFRIATKSVPEHVNRQTESEYDKLLGLGYGMAWSLQDDSSVNTRGLAMLLSLLPEQHAKGFARNIKNARFAVEEKLNPEVLGKRRTRAVYEIIRSIRAEFESGLILFLDCGFDFLKAETVNPLVDALFDTDSYTKVWNISQGNEVDEWFYSDLQIDVSGKYQYRTLGERERLHPTVRDLWDVRYLTQLAIMRPQYVTIASRGARLGLGQQERLHDYL